MMVPKTAMHKYDQVKTRHHYIWRPRQLGPMNPEPVPKAMQQLPDPYFR
jgi:hypothetical protein